MTEMSIDVKTSPTIDVKTSTANEVKGRTLLETELLSFLDINCIPFTKNNIIIFENKFCNLCIIFLDIIKTLYIGDKYPFCSTKHYVSTTIGTIDVNIKFQSYPEIEKYMKDFMAEDNMNYIIKGIILLTSIFVHDLTNKFTSSRMIIDKESYSKYLVLKKQLKIRMSKQVFYSSNTSVIDSTNFIKKKWPQLELSNDLLQLFNGFLQSVIVKLCPNEHSDVQKNINELVGIMFYDKDKEFEDTLSKYSILYKNASLIDEALQVLIEGIFYDLCKIIQSTQPGQFTVTTDMLYQVLFNKEYLHLLSPEYNERYDDGLNQNSKKNANNDVSYDVVFIDIVKDTKKKKNTKKTNNKKKDVVKKDK